MKIYPFSTVKSIMVDNSAVLKLGLQKIKEDFDKFPRVTMLPHFRLTSKFPFIGLVHRCTTVDDITIGQIGELENVAGSDTYFFDLFRVMCGMSRARVMYLPFRYAFRYFLQTTDDLTKIGDAFAALSIPMTAEEREFSDGATSYGIFDLIDFYVTLRPMYKHDDVARMTWREVYAVLDKNRTQVIMQRKQAAKYNRK